MKTCTLRIIDSVNCKFEGLDPLIRRRIVEKLKFFIPYARHTQAFKLGRWDGKVAFATVGGGTSINLLDRVLPLVVEDGYEIDLVDERPTREFAFPKIDENFVADRRWPAGHPMEGEPVLLRDYQVDAINRYLENLQSIQSISTGAGKTLTTACLSLLCEPYGRTLVIVPSKSLVEQTEEDFKNLGLDTGVYFGDRKELGHHHTIITWQSLGITSKNSKVTLDRTVVDELTRDLVCFQVDEVHTAKAESLKNSLGQMLGQVPIRWGMTGTVPQEEFEFLSILSMIGPVVGEIKAADLQEKGVLANLKIDILQTNDEHVEYADYAGEYDYLTSDKTRLTWIADHCTKVSENGNTLILVDRIECGQFLQKAIPGSVFISGSVNQKNRKKEYTSIQQATNKVIIATYGVASTGINIPRIFNLVLVEPGKSFTKIIQSIGRGIRKAADKDFVQVYDITSDMKFAKRHLAKRKVIYNNASYPFTIQKIKYR